MQELLNTQKRDGLLHRPFWHVAKEEYHVGQMHAMLLAVPLKSIEQFQVPQAWLPHLMRSPSLSRHNKFSH